MKKTKAVLERPMENYRERERGFFLACRMTMVGARERGEEWGRRSGDSEAWHTGLFIQKLWHGVVRIMGNCLFRLAHLNHLKKIPVLSFSHMTALFFPLRETSGLTFGWWLRRRHILTCTWWEGTWKARPRREGNQQTSSVWQRRHPIAFDNDRPASWIGPSELTYVAPVAWSMSLSARRFLLHTFLSPNMTTVKISRTEFPLVLSAFKLS